MGGAAGASSYNRKAIPIKDSLIAATAAIHGLAIAKRVDPFVT
jgi:predicted nucleic acid-binding protein